jgi:thiol-disulfide isomerase/thioredoxin
LLVLLLTPARPLAAQEPGVASSDSGADTVIETKPDPSVLVGRVTRDQVEAAVPNWVRAEIEAEVDPAAAAALAHVPPGAEVTVYLGTWCSDSRRELSHLWRALDEVGGMVDFRLDYIAVDRDKKQPAELVEGSGLHYVPTFIVRRDGEEVGRIVEEAPDGIVADLTSLLEGKTTGVISARDDVGPES